MTMRREPNDPLWQWHKVKGVERRRCDGLRRPWWTQGTWDYWDYYYGRVRTKGKLGWALGAPNQVLPELNSYWSRNRLYIWRSNFVRELARLVNFGCKVQRWSKQRSKL